MHNKIRHSDSDRSIQKTWVPEGTNEYTLFKLITQENQKLISVIQKHILLKDGDLVLDVGGRDGNVSFGVQKPQWVHIVDPDPTLRLTQKPGRFWNKKVQDVKFDKKNKYKLIICCHVLGYLGLQEAQQDVLDTLVELLEPGGTIVLFYNLNTGYIGNLVDYSKHVLPTGHYDFFDESILPRYRVRGVETRQLDIAFQLEYKSFTALSRGCWFLFGATAPNIGDLAKKFLPKLTNDLLAPVITVDERILFMTKKERNYKTPTLV